MRPGRRAGTRRRDRRTRPAGEGRGMTGLLWQTAEIVVGALYAASLPFSGWLVWEAHRIRRDA